MATVHIDYFSTGVKVQSVQKNCNTLFKKKYKKHISVQKTY